MKAMVIKFKDDSEMRLISGLLDKMKIQSKVLATEDLEDIGLGEMMLKVDRSDKVSRDMIMEKIGLLNLLALYTVRIFIGYFLKTEKAGKSGFFYSFF
ncbi:MAG TPA: hypothetical protein DCR40_12495 [Prolixibacteraceae bacterium]|nr:hypothetical protein [Prolixibacteraceae bacterium]